ncbi:hypothetical protein LVB87_08635 [Lysobacter sp. KIS68-7]|uniref:hypothetical protein n=1 Tax=Lysobacter sp. KIS68-7 TaxID=2904252 RepID=UPI001E6543C9|nr:hypothetical protein [Lysobacter sp. KIS68-7]UHQ18293.1 hypothetical protein LVB87_08635 [Lysobacter sp. KIS68-7]
MATAPSRGYITVSATIFSVIALLQAYRAFAGLPVAIGQLQVPTAASWVAALVLGALAVWGWRTR